MPEPDKLVNTIKLAVKAFREMPGRRGRLLCLANADEVLIGGDLHGNLANFRLLMEKAQLARYPRRHLVVQELVHGPFRYPAGGDKSHQMLDVLCALKCQFPRQVHMLLGNHELAQWTGQRIAKDDFEYTALFREGLGTAYGGAAARVYAAYTDLFASVPLAIRTRNRVFLSHSLPEANRLESFDPAVLERERHVLPELTHGGAVHALLWGRDYRPETVAAFLHKVEAELVITGHVACDAGFDAPNNRQLVLDSLGHPAAYCLFPTDRLLAHEELLACVHTL
jgi:hypothetical protein